MKLPIKNSIIDINMNSRENKYLILDTNAFYIMCNLFGKKDFGIRCELNNKINYTKLKKIFMDSLINKRLLIPSTTVYEFVCHLKDDINNLTKLVQYLIDLSNCFKYNIIYDAKGPIFTFTEERISIKNGYHELINKREDILLAKIGSESEIMIIFGRFVALLFFIYKNGEKFSKEVDMVKGLYNTFPFIDSTRHELKVINANYLHELYKSGMNDKKRYDTFENALQAAYTRMNMSLESEQDSGEIVLKTDNFTLRRFAQSNIQQKDLHKWYKKNKNMEKLCKIIGELLIPFFSTDFSMEQLLYLTEASIDLLVSGRKIGKNDAEDYYNLGYLSQRNVFLITFDKRMIKIIKKINKENFEFISSFYEYDK